jgi:lysophospholipase L1-like esterase
MRAVWPVVALAAALAAAVTGCSSPGTASSPGPASSRSARHSAPPVSYYLALGDSLSQGVQPDSSGASVKTQDGYANQLYSALRTHQPGLRLVKLGCRGETTATMISGGVCRYPGGSQLAAAVRFLGAHRGHVSLITIDIGANDPFPCFTRPSITNVASCTAKAIPAATGNLTKILRSLLQAAGNTRIIAMTYYLPALAEWRNGLMGRLVAHVSELATVGYNGLLTRTYQTFGVRVANVFAAFNGADFGNQVTVPGYGTLPRNVAAICTWTWECAGPPRGPNEHPNQAGYAVIARAFLQADD